jgi:hypothetical protein
MNRTNSTTPPFPSCLCLLLRPKTRSPPHTALAHKQPSPPQSLPPSGGLRIPLRSFNVVLQCLGLTAWYKVLLPCFSSTCSSCFLSSSINTFIASFEMEYGTDNVGGSEPVFIACTDVRPDEMLTMRGSGERRSNGIRTVVRTATDVTLVMKWSLYVLRRSPSEAFGLGMSAIAALLISTF